MVYLCEQAITLNRKNSHRSTSFILRKYDDKNEKFCWQSRNAPIESRSLNSPTASNVIRKQQLSQLRQDPQQHKRMLDNEGGQIMRPEKEARCRASKAGRIKERTPMRNLTFLSMASGRCCTVAAAPHLFASALLRLHLRMPTVRPTRRRAPPSPHAYQDSLPEKFQKIVHTNPWLKGPIKDL